MPEDEGMRPEGENFPRRGWGPDAKTGVVSFTFDNLGEAADIEFGLWPADKPVGDHPTVTTVVPELLERLVGFHATFFVEAWNAEIYPATLRAMATAGHQVGLHGWRHEVWAKLASEDQERVLRRSLAAMAEIGLRPRGFRPPGGAATDDLPAVMARHGFSHFSAVGEGSRRVGATVASLPFAWTAVDGNHLEADMAAAFAIPAGPDGRYGPAALEAAFRRRIDWCLEAGDHAVFVFHPWISGAGADRLDAVFRVIDYAREKDDLWIASCEEVAQWLLSKPSGDPN